jgi:hypothetical protein
MDVTRRTALIGAGSLAFAPAALAAASARRNFTILRGRSDVGRHQVSLTRQGDTLEARIDVEIVVRVLGIPAYRYEMTNREVWRAGLLQSVDSSVNDDGRRKRVRVTREGAGLMVASDFYTGPAPSDAATTTYFTTDFLERGMWISTDSGEVYRMAISPAGEAEVATANGAVAAARWRATNGTDFDVTLFYDARGEWASVAFDAGGEPARYRPEHLDESFMAVWNG